jgi:hypothetical protein
MMVERARCLGLSSMLAAALGLAGAGAASSSTAMGASPTGKALDPNALIQSINRRTSALDRRITMLYHRHNRFVTMWPGTGKAPSGAVATVDWYVLRIPSGTRDGRPVYNEFVDAIPTKGSPYVGRGLEYQLAHDITATPKGVSPAFNSSLPAASFQQLAYSGSPTQSWGVSESAGCKRGQLCIFGVDTVKGAFETRAGVVPLGVSKVAPKFAAFETGAARLLAKAG